MISFIISYRQLDNYRKRNIDFIIDFLYKIDIEKEIIVVENDIKEKYKNDKVKKIFIKTEGQFEKSKCYNVGAKNAKYDLLFFNDCDIVMPVEFYIQSIKDIGKDNDVVDPYRKVYYYDDRLTKKVIRNNNGKHFNGEIGMSLSGVISGGCFIIKKDYYVALKGMDELCVGYGYEDDIFDIKMKKMKLKIKHNWENYCLHLYHPPVSKTENTNYYMYLYYLNIQSEDLYKKIKNTIW